MEIKYNVSGIDDTENKVEKPLMKLIKKLKDRLKSFTSELVICIRKGENGFDFCLEAKERSMALRTKTKTKTRYKEMISALKLALRQAANLIVSKGLQSIVSI